MRILGYCLRCHRFKQVRVTGSGLALAQRGVACGICAQCEEADRGR